MTALEFSYQLQCQEGPLNRFARYLTRNDEYSKDLVQDTMLKAFLYRQSFRNGSNMKAWLNTIMRNIFLNERKRLSNWPLTPIELADYKIASYQDLVLNDGPEQLAFEEINLKLTGLTETVRIPFELSQQGYHYDEIAETLQISVQAVKSRIFSARKQLQLRLGSDHTKN